MSFVVAMVDPATGWGMNMVLIKFAQSSGKFSLEVGKFSEELLGVVYY